MIIKEIIEFFQSLIDEIIALLVIGGAMYFVYLGMAVPEALWVAFGMVIEFYFTKKTIGYLNHKGSV